MGFAGNGKSDILGNHVINLYSVFGLASIAHRMRGYAQNKVEMKRDTMGTYWTITLRHQVIVSNPKSQCCCSVYVEVNKSQMCLLSDF